MGRIETVAQEISRLQKNVDSVLELDKETQIFSLTVDFTARSQPAKVRVCFDLGHVSEWEYPMAPMRAHAESRIGEVDTVHLRTVLSRSVKPGFGYLTRACDTVAAYMK